MLNRERPRSALDALGRAANGSADRGMRPEFLEDAPTFVETNVENGTELTHAFWTALAFGEPWRHREAVAGRVAIPEMGGDGDLAAVRRGKTLLSQAVTPAQNRRFRAAC